MGHPLSPLQQSLDAQAAAHPGLEGAISLTVGLRGPLDPETLRTALRDVVQHHELLRARFEPVGPGRLEIRIDPAREIELRLEDWSGRSSPAREAACRELERALRHDPLPGGAAPLRAALARTGEESHVLVLAQSALVTDWRSLWRLVQEILAWRAGETPADEPLRFTDLALWLQETLEGEDAETGIGIWKRVDPASADELRLGLAGQREVGDNAPRREVGHGARPLELSRELSERTADGLLQLARGRSMALEAILCALWQTWLARLGETDRHVIGVRSAGRAFQGLDEALGPFERALPVEARIDARTGFLDLARQTDEQLARGAEWHEFFHPPLLGLAPGFAFRHGFEYLPLQADHTRGALRAGLLRRDGHAEAFHALLRVEETTRGTELRFVLDPRHFGEADLAAIADPFLDLLENALARPDALVASLPATTPTSTAALLELARGPELAVDERRTAAGIHGWILETARSRPTAIAVEAEGGRLSYGELDRRSAALAHELVLRGVRPGAFVGVHLERSVDLPVALLAVLRAGAAYVPLPPAWPRERVLAMLADSGADVVIGSTAPRTALDGFRGSFVSVHAPDTNATGGAGFETRERARGDDLAYLIYTSGSSGKPKGVPISHANLVYSTRARLARYPGAVERYLLLSSFAFDSSVAGIFWTLVSGGTLVLPPDDLEKDLSRLPELVRRSRPTHLLGLPSLWSLLLEQSDDAGLASLTTVIVAGEACPPELVRHHRSRLPRTALYNEYGPTEGTVWSTVFDAREEFERARVPIGRPIPGARTYVLTPERDLAPIGVAGELWIAGPGVARGYHERPELTAERFAADPFEGERMYRTGDRARWLPGGNLEFLGRLDQQLKIRGFRIEPGEIEGVLASHPAVGEALVTLREDAGAAPRLVAYATALGTRPAETDLLRFLAERLPEHMVPSRTVCLDEWPRLPNGKVDTRALPPPGESRGFEEPEGALETVLAALWADVLGLDQVGRHDDFFALGGHSLSATRLYARLKETLQVKLPLRALFTDRTPAALARTLRAEPDERARVESLAEMVLALLESEPEAEGRVGA